MGRGCKGPIVTIGRRSIMPLGSCAPDHPLAQRELSDGVPAPAVVSAGRLPPPHRRGALRTGKKCCICRAANIHATSCAPGLCDDFAPRRGARQASPAMFCSFEALPSRKDGSSSMDRICLACWSDSPAFRSSWFNFRHSSAPSNSSSSASISFCTISRSVQTL